MKRLLYLILLGIATLNLQAQNGAVIDDLFQKYSGKEGITSVYISSKMFSMFNSQETKDDDLSKTLSRLKSIRILSVEDSTLNDKINFYEELRKKVDFTTYEELMVVNEADNVTKFLIRESGNIIAELLIISGGKKGNTLISIRGDLDLKNISGLSKTMGIQQLENLDKLEKKPQNK